LQEKQDYEAGFCFEKIEGKKGVMNMVQFSLLEASMVCKRLGIGCEIVAFVFLVNQLSLSVL